MPRFVARIVGGSWKELPVDGAFSHQHRSAIDFDRSAPTS